MMNRIIKFFLENKLVAWLLLLLFTSWGIATAPFDLGIDLIPRDSVAVDAIPDIGENQQVVFTKWIGRSPQDVEDQITYPLTTSLLGIPGVKSVRSNSMFGFSTIYLIFEEDIEFYWSRSRILEKLNSLPSNLLPEDVQPTLGPDATALGQIFWYTLEGRDQDGNPSGGWDLHELRSIQDFYVRYGLAGAGGVSEVASIGGFVREYQVDVNPDKLRIYDISLQEVMKAVKESNLDIGAQTMEINLVEYFVRGLGYISSIKDLEESVVKAKNNVPIRIKDIAKVNYGPANRRGVLDRSGAEAVGGVVVARYGANPLEVINNVKAKIAEISPGLPNKTLANGTISKIEIIPFYDRTKLINETLGTLEEALSLEILITVIVVILMLFDLRSSLLISGALPLAVLMCFIAMRYFGVDANIVALSGIGIAIGTMVDIGIVLTESIVTHLKKAKPGHDLQNTIYEATTEVASAIVTAVVSTIISFLPVFTMQAAEGKLFRPLAFTKTFALVASIVVAITIIPPLAVKLFGLRSRKEWTKLFGRLALTALGGVLLFTSYPILGSAALGSGILGLITKYYENRTDHFLSRNSDLIKNAFMAIIVALFLSKMWMPLGVAKSYLLNFTFVALTICLLLGTFYLIIHYYERILRALLKFKYLFIVLVMIILASGFQIMRNLGQEFMPSLDEGSFLYMPTAMPHAGMEMNIANLKTLDMAVTAIPEVETVVGKAGRVESALDPAPMSMYENIILYSPEYKTDENGKRQRFKVDEEGNYLRDQKGLLILDRNGRYYRQWRDHIHSPDDIWQEILKVTKLPGITSAPKLQPIETRLIMLQTGMRAPMGIKIKGSDLKLIESFALELEQHLMEVEGVKKGSVFAERIVGKPYLLIDIETDKIDRYGLSIQTVQNQIQAAVGGMIMSTTVEGRERYAIRVRYPRELRNDIDKLMNIYVSNSQSAQVLLGDLVTIKYGQGPQAIKSEDGFMVGYVLFDKMSDQAETDIVLRARSYLENKIENGELIVPEGINYQFAGNYEHQERANKRLALVVPISLLLIFLILYFQFRSIATSLMVYSGVFMAFAGGFIMIWLYGQDWFMNFDLFGINMRELFQIRTVNLSIAVWVGFLALFGIADDDGILVATYLKDSFKRNDPQTIKEVRDAVVEAGVRRVRPAMMTSATTILALLPILTSTGRGSDIMLPMAIPSVGGMALQCITMFTVPILYSIWREQKLRKKLKTSRK